MTAGLPVAPLSQSAEQVAAAIVAGLDAGATVVWAPPVLRWLFLVLRHLPQVVFRRLRG